MKKIIITSIMLLSYNTFAAQNTEAPAPQETGSSVLSYEGEVEYFKALEKSFKTQAVFPQTKWRECDDSVTGNYTGFRCANRRGISKILKGFMAESFLTCVNQGLRKVEKSRAVDLHVTHDGIQGDANHSPRSLHAEARAVDVDSFVVIYANGREERLTFEGSRNDSFFNSFRSCWGKVINQQNGCPLISGRADRTGSIGKEDSRHRKHMHVSVPYCVGGNYAGNYFRR